MLLWAGYLTEQVLQIQGELMTSPWQEYKKRLGSTRPWDIFKAEAHNTDEQTAIDRYAVCLECPELLKITKQCKQCGCMMPLKVQLKAAEFPLVKWQS